MFFAIAPLKTAVIHFRTAEGIQGSELGEPVTLYLVCKKIWKIKECFPWWRKIPSPPFLKNVRKLEFFFFGQNKLRLEHPLQYGTEQFSTMQKKNLIKLFATILQPCLSICNYITASTPQDNTIIICIYVRLFKICSRFTSTKWAFLWVLNTNALQTI